MKQIRVKTPFLDITKSNKRREVGDILLVKEERAAYLVNGRLCEYVEEEKPAATAPQTPAAPADKPAGEVKKEAKETQKKAATKGSKK